MCLGCPSIVRANDHAAGVGEHEDFCLKEVKFSCVCGQNFRADYSGVQSMLSSHLINECPSVLSPNTRRLTRAFNKFEDLKLHPRLIKFYKELEPFYWLDPSDERDERFPLPKTYVSSLNN